MWHINRKPMKSSIQICQLNAHLTTHLTVSSWKWPENRFFYNCFFSGEHVHTEWDKKLIFYMDIGSDLYFHIMNQNWPGSTRDPPPRGVTTPKIKKTHFGSCDISIKSTWKALYKYVNWMLIWPLIWPSAAENDQKMAGKSFFYNCFFQGSMSTPNEIRSCFSTSTLVLTYIFISWIKIGWGWHVTPPQWGGNHPKN